MKVEFQKDGSVIVLMMWRISTCSEFEDEQVILTRRVMLI